MDGTLAAVVVAAPVAIPVGDAGADEHEGGGNGGVAPPLLYSQPVNRARQFLRRAAGNLSAGQMPGASQHLLDCSIVPVLDLGPGSQRPDENGAGVSDGLKVNRGFLQPLAERVHLWEPAVDGRESRVHRSQPRVSP